MIISFYMESLLIAPQMIRHEQQLVVNDNLLRRRREFSDSCSSSTSIIEEEEEEEDQEVSSLQDMSSLLLQLPLKRGLSRHYNGKSQSFTNLSHVKSLGDLAKQENPFKKKIKICSSSSSSRKEPPTMGSHFPS